MFFRLDASSDKVDQVFKQISCSAFHQTFDKRFLKFNGKSERSCEFHAKFPWEVAKFVESEVRVIQCSWFGN